MRFLLTLAAYAALTVSGFAQAPNEISVTDTIRLHPGEARVFRFDQPITKWVLPDEIIKISGDTDQTFTFNGLRPGATILSGFAPNGEIVYRTNVVVAGGLVRIYGTKNKDELKDYIGFVCSENGCGRADPETEKPITSSSVAVTRRNSRGEIITTTRQY